MVSVLFTKTPLLFLVQSLWRDEAFSYLLAKKSLIEIAQLSGADFNPPFYYVLLHFWMQIAGTSEVALRLLSLIFFWATLYVVYLFLTNILKIRSRWLILYLLLFLANPLLNYYAFEARMYALLAFLATLSFYLFYQRKYIPYIFITSLGLYTHYFMIFVIISQLITVFVTERNTKKIESFFKSLILIFLACLPWLLLTINNRQFSSTFWVSKPSWMTFFAIPALIYTGYEFEFGPSTILLLAFSLLLLIIFVLGFLSIRSSRIFVFLLSWSLISPLIIFLISLAKPIFFPRYLIFAAPGFLLLLIFLLERFKNKYRIIIFMTLVGLTLSYNQLQIKNRQKADLRKVIGEIRNIAKQDDLLYVTDELNFHPAEYYFNEKRVFIYGKTYEEIPNYVGKVLIPKEKITHSLPQYPQKAFILKDNLTYDIQAVY